MPGVVNCISCNIMGDIAWQIEVDGDLILSIAAAQFVSTMNNYLIIAMPEDYVEPGTSGRRDILCSAPTGTPSLEARLASPSKIDLKVVINEVGFQKQLYCQSKFHCLR